MVSSFFLYPPLQYKAVNKYGGRFGHTFERKMKTLQNIQKCSHNLILFDNSKQHEALNKYDGGQWDQKYEAQLKLQKAHNFSQKL
jgi:hypothetical protein